MSGADTVLGRYRVPRRRRWLAGLLVAGLLIPVLAAGLERALPPELSRFEDRGQMVLDRSGQPLRAFGNSEGVWRLKTRPADVDPLYLAMLKAYEDRRFDSHPGVDPLAVIRAAGQWIANGRPVSGASTLSMQAARLLEPRPRTLFSKALEMARALQLENRLGKAGVLEVYLTLAPMGGNVEGVTAASLLYFGKLPKRLTPAEAALLVALPQSPTKRRPDRHEDVAREARDTVLYRVAAAGVIDLTTLAEALSTPVPGKRFAMPMQAPHLSRHLAYADPDQDRIETTIDASWQASAQNLLRRHVPRLESGGAIAALVMENATGAVRAYLGSADFADASRHGQVDMVRAIRSPGSTLKPFIFGLAFHDRILAPETRIEDRPMRFGDYAPRNFNERFHGEVSAAEALRLSLNVPAVAVLNRVGPARLDRILRSAGVNLVYDPRIGRPTLPMALGGLGVTLWDLTAGYRAMATGSSLAAPHVRVGEAMSNPIEAPLDPLAAWQVRRILSDAAPPPGRPPARDTAGGRIAYKTGTSYGFRDAWAIGMDGTRTIGIWVGRPDGGYGRDQIGQRTAAPILFDLFDLLPEGGDPVGPAPPGAAHLMAEALPPPLRQFRAGDDLEVSPHSQTAEGSPKLGFPLDGSIVELPGLRQTLVLEAEGGQMPLTWLVNGRPVETPPHRRRAEWLVSGPGYATIAVIDSLGRADRATVEIRQ